MTEFPTLAALAQHLMRESVHGELVTMKSGLAQVGGLLAADMRQQIGHYQAQVGAYPEWAPLADSTEDQKAAMGAPADAPLERFGDLKDSFHFTVTNPTELIVGSTDPVMTYHEFGTSKMPPRPVVGPALLKNIDEVKNILGCAVLNVKVAGQHLGYAFDETTGIPNSAK